MGEVSGTNQLRIPLKQGMRREQRELWLELQCVFKGTDKTGLARARAWAQMASDQGTQEELGHFRKARKSKTHELCFFLSFLSHLQCDELEKVLFSLLSKEKAMMKLLLGLTETNWDF